MQRLPEATDRNTATQRQRKGTTPTKGEMSFSFSGDRRSDNI